MLDEIEEGAESPEVVIEPGGEDNSTEMESNVDESVNVTILTPAPLDAGEHGHPDLAHCEHCETHAATIAALEGRIAAMETAEVTEEIEEAVEEPVDVAPAEEPPAEDVVDEAPKRTHFLHRKVFGK